MRTTVSVRIPLRSFALSLLLTSAITTAPAAATVARRIADLGPEPNALAFGSNPRGFRTVGNRVVFVTDLGVWSTDGTPSGTRRLAPGDVAGFSEREAYLWGDEDRLVFGTVDGRLWITEGPPSSTRPLDLTLDEGVVGPVASAGGRLYVSRGSQLWSFDPAGDDATLVRDFGYPAHPASFVAWNGGLAFTATVDCDGRQGVGVWRTNAAGTAASRLYCDPEYDVYELAAADGGLLVRSGTGTVRSVAPDGHSVTLFEWGGERFQPGGSGVDPIVIVNQNAPVAWTSDGTPQGTRSLFDLTSYDGGGWAIALGPVPTAGGPAAIVTRYDGAADILFPGPTASSPRSVRSLCGVSCSDLDALPFYWAPGEEPFAVSDGTLYFVGEDPDHGIELWRTDGTRAGTGLVADACPGSCGTISALSTVPGGAAFRAGAEDESGHLWIARGEEVFSLGRVVSFQGYPPTTAWTLAAPSPARGGAWLFQREDTLHGAELWAGDATKSRLLVDLGQPQPSPGRVAAVVPLGDLAWMATCRDQGSSSRFEYWTSDGTPVGTHVYSQRTRACNPNSNLTIRAAALAERVVVEEPTGIVLTDGTEADPPRVEGSFSVVPSGASSPVAYLQALASNDLWVTDGTVAGTHKIAAPGYWNSLSSFVLDGRLYFVGGPQPQSRLWTSDGTAAGTHPLSAPGAFEDAVTAFSFVALGDAVYFLATRDDPAVGRVDELWKTGVTEGSAVRVKRLHTGYPERTGFLAVWNGALYFLRGQADDTGREEIHLWTSDGTASGTRPLGRLARGLDSVTTALQMMPTPSGLLFAGHSPAGGLEPWITDGTVAGSHPLNDLAPGGVSSAPQFLRSTADGRVFFSVETPAHGRELWVTDGTAAGTRLVHDLFPGASGSGPARTAVAADHLFFLADDGLAGREPWALPLSDAGPSCVPDDDSLCLQGGRFRVEIDWIDFTGRSGVGHTRPLTGDSGAFWFFHPDNVEVLVKVLDGRGNNGHFWTFYGALSNVEYRMTVTDTATGATHRYVNPSGLFASAGDTRSFGPLGADPERQTPFVRFEPLVAPATPVSSRPAAAAEGCVPGPTRHCLGGRFAVEATWKDFEGHTGQAKTQALTDDTGLFWFFGASNVELAVKVLDGNRVNGHFWVFYGSLSNVGFTITVTDTETGLRREYRNPVGVFASRGDTKAFPAD